MMNAGRLVWHRENDGSWMVDSQIYPPDFWYIIYPATACCGGWTVEVCSRTSKAVGDLIVAEELGTERYLKDAKRIADEHHHAQIKLHGDDGIKAYIQRYPLEGSVS